MPDQTRTLNGQNSAPPPGQPGMGAGNVPFAPGIMSGNLGTSSPAPRGQAAGAPPRQMSMPGQAPPMGGIINPQVYFQVMNAWMESLIEATEQPGNNTFGIY